MLSKNNYHEKLRKMEPRKERFSIRKFSIGAASVLIGFSFMSMAGNQKVQAATEENPVVVNNAKNNEQQSKTDGVQSAEQQLNKIQSSANVVNDKNNESANAENVKTTTTSSQNSTDSKLTPSTAQQDLKNVAKDTATEVKQDKQVAQPEDTKATTETSQNTNTLNLNKVPTAQASVKESKIENRAAKLRSNDIAAILATNQETQKTLRGTQTQDVSNWQGLVNALNDSSVGTINLTSDITVANKGTNINGIRRPNPLVNSGKMNLTGSNISGGLIIDG